MLSLLFPGSCLKIVAIFYHCDVNHWIRIIAIEVIFHILKMETLDTKRLSIDSVLLYRRYTVYVH